MFYRLRKARAEAKLAETKAQQEKLAVETKANAQLLRIYASARRQKEGTHDLNFSEEELRRALGRDGERLHTVLNLMLGEGIAEKTEIPGYWIID